jgi:hypothetical protein
MFYATTTKNRLPKKNVCPSHHIFIWVHMYWHLTYVLTRYHVTDINHVLTRCHVTDINYVDRGAAARAAAVGLGSQSKHQNETKSETNMVFAPVLFLRNKLRPASGRFPVSRNETKVQIARFVSMSSLNPCFCIVPWAPNGNALVRCGVVLCDLKKASSKTG